MVDVLEAASALLLVVLLLLLLELLLLLLWLLELELDSDALELDDSVDVVVGESLALKSSLLLCLSMSEVGDARTSPNDRGETRCRNTTSLTHSLTAIFLG